MNLKGRWITIAIVLIAAIISIYPNLVDLTTQEQKVTINDAGESITETVTANKHWWPTKNKIVYGLDIQGGLHLVLGVDVEDVMVEKTKRLAGSVTTDLKGKELGHINVTVSEENPLFMNFNTSKPTDEASVSKFIEDFYPATLQVIETLPNKIVVQYYQSKADEYKKQVIGQAIEVIRNRIDEFGVTEPSITAQGSDRILVQLPGIKDSARAKDLINKTARLNFRVVSVKMPGDQVFELVQKAETDGKFKLGFKDGGEGGNLAYSKYVKEVNKVVEKDLPQSTRIVFEKVDGAKTLVDGKRPYLIDTSSSLSGDLLEDANVGVDQYGKPEVTFRFSIEGRRKFADLSEQAIGGQLAIVLDDVVKSAPSVSARIDSDSARITLGSGGSYQDTYDEAQLIATSLRAGALPAALQQLEERTVGPTLGADSIRRGKLAGMVGLGLVLIFMLFYYRRLGVVACTSLVFNIILILAVLTMLGATLTLPGVAGIILTIGMAVDANVIIFERIKEELSKGSGIALSVKNGFDFALSAILDANITTAAVCVVLMYFGTGPIRGFAVTLLAGIVTSMFTSIFVSRTIIEWSIVKRGLKKI